MSDDVKRRPLLKAIGTVVGAGTALAILPSSWTRPVVQSVVVPAHATASGVTTRTTTSTTTSTSTTPLPQ
jgi:hypothetical protein